MKAMMPLPLLATLALGACATDGTAPLAPSAPGECSAAAAQGLIGRQGTAELAAEALRLTGLRTVRWIWPGQAVTMDYRADRLDIALDADGKVERITCG
jgi:hypothetical protein